MSFGATVFFLAAIACATPIRAELFFEENRGQTVPEVQFLAQGSPSVFFTQHETVVAFASGEVVRIQPVGAVAREPEALELLPGKSSYLNREPSIVNVRQYARVRYRSIYPGVDLTYHGHRNQIEYDFEAAPGAHPERIRLRLLGANGLNVDGEGNLIAHIGSLTFIQKKPEAWQSGGGLRSHVDVRYSVCGKDEISFEIGAYDHNHALIIDPLIDYVTDLGALATSVTNDDTPTGIAGDASGNAYIIGSATSGKFPITSGTAPTTSSNNGFVAKLSANGSKLLYSTHLNLPVAQAILVDKQGSVYVGGLNYVAKLTPDGSAFTYNHAFLSNLGATVSYLALDLAGNVYAAGYTYSTNFPTTAGAYQATFPGQVGILGSNTSYGFLMKLDPSGNVVYSTYLRQALGGVVSQFATQFLAINPVAQNAIIVTATTPTATGQASASLLKFGPNGQVLSTTNVATSPIIVESVANDADGNIYLSCNGPGFNGQISIGPNFLLEFDPNDAIIATKTIPFYGDLHIDASGNLYVVAAVRADNNFPETPTVTRVASDFTSVVTTPLTGGTITDQIQSSAADPVGNVYVVLTPSNSSSPQISATPGAYQTSGGAFAVLKADAAVLAGLPLDTPLITAVTNAASGEAGFLAASEIITIYGQNLGPAQLISATFDSDGLLPTILAGTTVLVGGQPVPILYTSASQIAAIAPVSLTGSAVAVSVQGVLSPPALTTVLPAIPGLFSADASGHGQGAILNQDGSVNSVSNPAARNSVVSLFCSGCGVTTPPGIDGAITNSLAVLANPIVAIIGNQPAQISYAGAAPGLVNGAVQINAKIPFGVAGDAVQVSVIVGSAIPPSLPVTLAVR